MWEILVHEFKEEVIDKLNSYSGLGLKGKGLISRTKEDLASFSVVSSYQRVTREAIKNRVERLFRESGLSGDINMYIDMEYGTTKSVNMVKVEITPRYKRRNIDPDYETDESYYYKTGRRF